MTKAALVVTLVVLFAGFLYWFDSTSEWLRDLEPAEARRSAESISTPTQRQAERPQQKPQPIPKEQLLKEVAVLEQELEQAQSDLQVRFEELESLKRQQEEQRTLSGSSTEAQVDAQAVEIANLNTVLESSQSAENNIARSADAALREQAMATQLAQSQIDNEIRSLQKAIGQTRSEIADWTLQFYNRTLRETRLTELRSQLASQEQNLESLRNQRTQILANSLARTREINAAAQREQGQLELNQSDIQNQIIQLRGHIQRTEAAQKKAQENITTLEAQITKAEENYRAQQQRVGEIRERLDQKRQQIL